MSITPLSRRQRTVRCVNVGIAVRGAIVGSVLYEASRTVPRLLLQSTSSSFSSSHSGCCSMYSREEAVFFPPAPWCTVRRAACAEGTTTPTAGLDGLLILRRCSAK
ncbi:unnamed protein product [Ectocarpus sp. 12 AP-2014]